MISNGLYTVIIFDPAHTLALGDFHKQFPYIDFLHVSSDPGLHKEVDLMILVEKANSNDDIVLPENAVVWGVKNSLPDSLLDDILPPEPGQEYLFDKIQHFIEYLMQAPLAHRSLMQLANAIQNAVIIFNAKGDILWVNKAFEKIYGYKKQAFIQKFGRNLYSFSPTKGIEKKIAILKESKKSLDYLSSIHTPDGEIRYLQTTLSPVFDGTNIKWLVAIEADITGLKTSKILMEEQSASLQKMTEELTDANHELKAQSDKLSEQHQELTREKERTDELLHNILPEVVAHQLKKGKKKPKRHKSVTVMFADFKGFTKICKKHEPAEIVHTLDELFSIFDTIAEKHYLEKIKTIGDAYMCAGGMPMKNKSHHVNTVMAALEIQQFLFEYNKPRMLKKETVWECRIGIHSGEVFAGVVGQKKFAYDIWGDTVNLASRMETSGAVNSVNISETTHALVKDYFECIPRGEINVKNIGKVNMFFVVGLKPEYTDDPSGVRPNKKFEAILRRL
ncbi:Adenylate cyclase [Salinivirga cyanobacteriivorans]|uniref:guanylate cyclase n=1 Tax=Salinivirga cyanobacteriivorans TaxID=1307839 RepID=A0A0S2HY96_9BACT|nr:adenylate/guanylate cyclase domain-containing protein [Salinivirga cyanobacteriivorans]ALO15097.1 Adenylate cyclase [Salinivirga cyanobacteriivorans]